jgi:hypothetical protein
MQPISPPSGKRHNLFVLAFKHFPSGLLATAIGIAFLSAPLLYNLFRDNGFDSIFWRVVLSGAVIGVVPLSFLYIATLLRAPKIRRRLETEAELQLEIISGDLQALEAKEKKEEKEVIRLEQVVKGDMKARKVKDEKEAERWDSLNERLRVQEETGQHNIDEKEEREIARQELASEARILAAQQVKDIKEEHEVARQELATAYSKAQKVKDRKDDARWDLLNESLRLQKETGELASEEALLVAQQVKDIKDEGEVMRKGLVSDDLEARHVKDLKEDKRWDLLTEQLRLQNETAELASEERILVAQQVKDVKDEGEVMRKGLASDDLEARHIKESKEEKRWSALDERMRIQEERSEEREKRQILRDDEYARMRHEDDLKDQYRMLFARFLRNSIGNKVNQEVADGLAPIPEDWLKEQPEIRKNPTLAQLLEPYNVR